MECILHSRSDARKRLCGNGSGAFCLLLAISRRVLFFGWGSVPGVEARSAPTEDLGKRSAQGER